MSNDSLTLHVPQPTSLPGEKQDFSHFLIPKAGSALCPPVDANPTEIRELAYSIIRKFAPSLS